MAKTKKPPPPRFHKTCLLAKGRHMGLDYAVTAAPGYGKNGYLFIPDDHPWSNLTLSRLRAKSKRIESILESLPFYIDHSRRRKGLRWIGFNSPHVKDHVDLPDADLVKREFRERMIRDKDGEPRWRDKGDSEEFHDHIFNCVREYRYALSDDWKPSFFEPKRPTIISIDRMVKLMKKACKVAHRDAAKW
jgi:hypothetical protein